MRSSQLFLESFHLYAVCRTHEGGVKKIPTFSLYFMTCIRKYSNDNIHQILLDLAQDKKAVKQLSVQFSLF